MRLRNQSVLVSKKLTKFTLPFLSGARSFGFITSDSRTIVYMVDMVYGVLYLQVFTPNAGVDSGVFLGLKVLDIVQHGLAGLWCVLWTFPALWEG